MAKRSKKYIEAVKKIDRSKEYTLDEAVSLIKDIKYSKTDETFEGHFRVRYKSLQNVRGSLTLPHGTGKKVKVLVFAKGEKAEEAKSAGADYVGDMDLIEKVQGGWVDFDFVVSTPDMMKDVGKLGPVLGRKGLMPKPKLGTVTLKVDDIVKQLKSGRIEYKSDKTGVVHLTLGKLSFEANKLVENTRAAIAAILRDKPSDAKGDYVASVAFAGTQTPGIKVSTKELRA